MKFNGTIFSKPQQDQLKENIGNELEKVTAKVDEVDARMLNYKGDWAEGKEYHENDIVTWADDGNLYEVIKAHTSSTSIKPDNTEYYKAMTMASAGYNQYTLDLSTENARDSAISLLQGVNQGKRAIIIYENVIYSVNRVSQLGADFVYTKIIYDGSYTPLTLENRFIHIERNYGRLLTIKINTDGTFSNPTSNIGNVTLLIEK